MVTSPQEVALAEVRKAIGMFREMHVHILGLVENMSTFCRGHANERIELFGAGGGETLSRETALPLPAAIPLDIELRKGGDVGLPIVVGHPESETSRVFREMARKIMAFPSTLGRMSEPSTVICRTSGT